MSVISAVNSVVSAGLFFLLGPYVGLCITRWWQMRTEFLGGVWGAVADLNMWASVWFHSGSKGDVAARSLVQRYAIYPPLVRQPRAAVRYLPPLSTAASGSGTLSTPP